MWLLGKKNTGNIMRIKCLVVGVVQESWFRGTKDERQVTILNLIDRDVFLGHKLRDAFDYQPTKEETEQINLASLDGAEISLGVHVLKPSSGGRFKLIGSIDRSGLPKTALGPPSPVKV
jgi:hypothetical protein